jgi:hypothetical protein
MLHVVACSVGCHGESGFDSGEGTGETATISSKPVKEFPLNGGNLPLKPAVPRIDGKLPVKLPLNDGNPL